MACRSAPKGTRLPYRHDRNRRHGSANAHWPQPVGNCTRRRSTTSGTPRSTAAASTSTPRTRSNWPRASSARWPTSPPNGTGTAVGLAGAQLTATKNFGYRTSYEDEWSGDVKKYALDPNTGALPVDSHRQSDERAGVVGRGAARCAGRRHRLGHEPPDRDDQRCDQRRGPVSCRDEPLCRAADSLNAGWVDARVDARADRRRRCSIICAATSRTKASALSNFRVRSHILGDIVYSGAVPVGAPSQPYDRYRQSGLHGVRVGKEPRARRWSTSAPTTACCTRSSIRPSTADAGKEAWAYRSEGALHQRRPERHRAHAVARIPARRAQLSSSDWRVRFSSTSSTSTPRRASGTSISPTPTPRPRRDRGNDWRTILVGGLGAGGRAVYALDVTNPVALTDTEATSRHRAACCGRFTDRLRTWATSTTPRRSSRPSAYGWVALVASGYNNPGGKGNLYVLNPNERRRCSQTLLDRRRAPTPTRAACRRSARSRRAAGTPTCCRPTAAISRATSGVSTCPIPTQSNWKVELIAKLTDANGKAQPITTGVRVEIDQNNNVDRYLFVGTGKLLGARRTSTDTLGHQHAVRDPGRHADRGRSRRRRHPIPAPTSIPSTEPRSPGSPAPRPAAAGIRMRPIRAQKIVTDVYRGRADRRLCVLQAIGRPLPAP